MKNIIRELVILILAAFLLAAGVYYFLAPNEIAAGGTTGIAIIVMNYFPDINIGFLMMIMDIVLYIVGFFMIGPVFGIKTIFCSFTTSFFISIMQIYFPISGPMSHDILIQLIFGILMCGAGMAIAFSHEASTGGLDIAVKITNIFGGKISIYYAKDGSSEFDNAIIMTVLKKREFFELKKYVDSIDQNSFITAHDINEIHGNAYITK
ncbi:YitT family protein [Fusobacteria bacterium ZRK30]|nr:YitT family protein [Fusobacteria bacterium ZRK30]